jgi:DNA repair protein RecO (recombination protein O)
LEWSDEGILLHLKPHGEHGFIATFFTQTNGLRKGYLRASKKYPLQQGNLYYISSKSRLSSQLNLLNVEADERFATYIYLALNCPKKLAALNAIRALLMLSLIEDDHPSSQFYASVKHYIHEITLHKTLHHYALFELELLAHCGFGLDLSKCAVTHQTENLDFVSPKTGRAVTDHIGKPYADKLLKLPKPLTLASAAWTLEYLIESLTLSGFFLEKMLHEHLSKKLPNERNFFISLLQK